MAFRLPTRTIVGPGSTARLREIAEELPAGVVAVVSDPGVVAAGLAERAIEPLVRAGRETMLLTDVEPNPRVGSVDRMAVRAREAGCGSVVAIGGGSVIDAAKGVALLLTNPGRCAAYEGRNRFSTPAAPLVAIPTTCGTGSEVTWVSVLTVPEQGRKISVKGDGLFPVWALVDADLLITAPPALVASTGMDALTHAVEAVTGRPANPVSDALAAEAVRLLVRYLHRAVLDPAGDGEARREVMRASTLAGMAFGNADVGAVHCLSESLGGLYDRPHGLLNAVLLVPVLRAHGAGAEAALARLEQAVSGSSAQAGAAADAFLGRLEALGRDVSIPAYRELGIPTDAHAEVGRLAEANGSNGSNPRPWTGADYQAVLDALVA